MSYAAFDDVLKRYKPIGTMIGVGSLQVTTVDVSSIFIADAEGFVNGYLGFRYVVPVTTEPLITQVTCDIAIANMMLEKLGNIPDFMQPRYDRAVKQLENLRDGEMVLTGSGTTGVTTGDNEAYSTTGSYHAIFSPVLSDVDQAADSDLIDAERDLRVDDGD